MLAVENNNQRKYRRKATIKTMAGSSVFALSRMDGLLKMQLSQGFISLWRAFTICPLTPVPRALDALPLPTQFTVWVWLRPQLEENAPDPLLANQDTISQSYGSEMGMWPKPIQSNRIPVSGRCYQKDFHCLLWLKTGKTLWLRHWGHLSIVTEGVAWEAESVGSE